MFSTRKRRRSSTMPLFNLLVALLAISLTLSGAMVTSIPVYFAMGFCCLLFEECHHDIGVQFKTSHRHQDEERCVGADADEGVVANGDQSRHHCSKHHPGVDGVLPMIGAFKAHYEDC